MGTTSELLKALGIGGATLGAGAALHGVGLGKILEPLDYPRQALWNLATSPYRAIEEGSFSPLLGAIPGVAGATLGGLIGGPAGVLAGSALGGTLQGVGKASGRKEFDAPAVSDLTGTEDFLPNLAAGLALDPLTYAGLGATWRAGSKALKAATPIDDLVKTVPHEPPSGLRAAQEEWMNRPREPLPIGRDIENLREAAARPVADDFNLDLVDDIDLAETDRALGNTPEAQLPGAAQPRQVQPGRMTMAEAERTFDDLNRRYENLTPQERELFTQAQDVLDDVGPDYGGGPGGLEGNEPAIGREAFENEFDRMVKEYSTRKMTDAEAREVIRLLDSKHKELMPLSQERDLLNKAYEALGMDAPGVPKPIKGFYSRLEKNLNAMPETMEANKVLKHIRKAGEGVSDAEINWVGLDRYLEGKKGKVTRKELLDHFSENKIIVEELPANYGDQGDTTKGGKDYFEWLVKMPNAHFPAHIKDYPNIVKVDNPHGPGGKSWQVIAPDGKPMYHDAMFPTEEQASIYLNKMKKSYSEPHYDEQNILGFLTGHDRVGPNGEKILHIDQVQSQWHQDATKVRTKAIEAAGEPFDRDYDRLSNLIKIHDGEPEVVAKISAEMDAAEAAKKAAVENVKLTKDYGYATDENVRKAMDKRIAFEVETDALKQDLKYSKENDPQNVTHRESIRDKISDLSDKKSGIMNYLNDVKPDNPFKEEQTALLLKVAIRKAAEKGYDRITISPGEHVVSYTGGEPTGQKAYYGSYEEPAVAGTIPNWLNKYAKKFGVKVEPYQIGNTAHPELVKEYNRLEALQGELGAFEYRRSKGRIEPGEKWSDLSEPEFNKMVQDVNALIRNINEKLHESTDLVTASSLPINQKMRESIMTRGQPLLNIGAPLGGSALLAALMNQQES